MAQSPNRWPDARRDSHSGQPSGKSRLVSEIHIFEDIGSAVSALLDNPRLH
jgi:hypothetical protein